MFPTEAGFGPSAVPPGSLGIVIMRNLNRCLPQKSPASFSHRALQVCRNKSGASPDAQYGSESLLFASIAFEELLSR